MGRTLISCCPAQTLGAPTPSISAPTRSASPPIERENGGLAANEPASVSTLAGGGPRHIAFYPTKDFAYVNLELSSQATALKLDRSSGGLEPLQTVSSLPSDASAEGNTTAETLVHPSGRYLYVTNRGHASIACYRIDGDSGELRFIGTDY